MGEARIHDKLLPAFHRAQVPQAVMTSMEPGLLTIGELPRRVLAAGRSAAASNALVPIATRVHMIEDENLPFAVRVGGNIARKESAAQPHRDPFAPPYEPELHVGDISSSHTVLLNKYNVLPDHLLLVTRNTRPQTELLDDADFEAALIALAAFDGLVFYNGGREAGASQSHKHLQLVPLPIAPGPVPLPFASILESPEFEHGIGHCRELPFRHAVTPIPPEWWHAPHAHAPAARTAWHALWRSIGHEASQRSEQPLPYNLLMTRQRMWLVPRSRGAWEGIGINALGYAGALLVRDDIQYDHLLRVGPARLLAETGLS